MATPDFRQALYTNTLISLAILALTLLVFPRVVRNADKWVLSRRCIWGAGVLLAGATALLCFSDASLPVGKVLVALSGVWSGFSSGVLFLGWGRLYADVGTRVALIETSVAWVGAALLCVALSLAPIGLACTCVVVGSLGSAIILRHCTFTRPARPRPARPHQLQRRTRYLFARGMVGCLLVGGISGFSDVLTGYRFAAVPSHYEIFLAVGCACVALLMLAVALLSGHDFVTHAYRLVMLLLFAGCLLLPFMARTNTLAYVVMLGAYISFSILLCIVCIDISNYFDQPATRVFGYAFFTLYLGEVAGNIVSHMLTGALHQDSDLSIVVLVLTMAIAFAHLFLFTEKDLVETSLGEMTDEEEPERQRLSVFPRRRRGMLEDSSLRGDPSRDVDRLASDRQANLERITDLLSERFGLTPREREVLPLIILGRTISRIQEELHISQGTVGTHMRHIYQKAGVRNRQGLLDLIDELQSDKDAPTG